MKKILMTALLALAACSGGGSAPVDPTKATVTFEANGKAASTAPSGEDNFPAAASYVEPTGSLTIVMHGAVAPDTTRHQFSIQINGFRGGTRKYPVVAAAYARKDDAGHEFGYQAKAEELTVEITDFEIHDVANSPLREGTISGTFQGEMAYLHAKKEGNAYTEPLKITNGKFTNVKVSGLK
ncbi:MAG: hypothetical protein ACAI38_23525 [Myxococcota bacterium]|nr:hypothetical protein [Myxococcota bacterium]